MEVKGGAKKKGVIKVSANVKGAGLKENQKISLLDLKEINQSFSFDQTEGDGTILPQDFSLVI